MVSKGWQLPYQLYPLDSLQNRRVGVVQDHLQPVRGEIRKIVHAELLERRDQYLRLGMGLNRVLVGFELEFSGEQVGEDRQDPQQGRIKEAHEHQARVNREMLHPERREQARVIEEPAQG